MLKITNGTKVFEVTDGAYNDIYRHQGYQVIGNEAEKDFVPRDTEEHTKTADEIFVEELQEKPLSQWNKDEVKHYAAIKGIDITGTKNANEAKDIIRQSMLATGEEEE